MYENFFCGVHTFPGIFYWQNYNFGKIIIIIPIILFINELCQLSVSASQGLIVDKKSKTRCHAVIITMQQKN